jgi:hypothetical protein
VTRANLGDLCLAAENLEEGKVENFPFMRIILPKTYTFKRRAANTSLWSLVYYIHIIWW